MKCEIVLCLLTVCFTFAECFFRPGIPTFTLEKGANTGKPLFLTPLLEAGKIAKAQQQSKSRIGNVDSYSGFFTVNKKCGSNLFFWFFPSQNDWKSSPLLLWLQGGPGATSLYGLLQEIGPLKPTKSGLKKRKYSWNVHNNILIIDQPVGTGYSFTGDSNCYPTNETAVAKDLYSALIQFLILFPNLQQNKFFISGESYAGKYIPAIGYAVHQNNPTADIKIKLSGMLIGNGWVDPLTQTDYADYLYQIGFIDDNQREEMYKVQEEFVKDITAENYDLAESAYYHLSINMGGKYVSRYNYLKKNQIEMKDMMRFVLSEKTRRAIHVGNLKFNNGELAADNLRLDFFISVKPWVETLLEHYDMLFYNGQVDIICAYPMMEKFLRTLKWSGESDYKNATRYNWLVDNELAGYFKKSGHLMELMVRNAGHMVPQDRPYWAFQMVNIATGVFNRSFTDDENKD